MLAIAAKYGEPTSAVFAHDQWSVTDKPAFGPGTSFNWPLNGGRIRVGRLEGTPFVTFIRDERDQAINANF